MAIVIRDGDVSNECCFVRIVDTDSTEKMPRHISVIPTSGSSGTVLEQDEIVSSRMSIRSSKWESNNVIGEDYEGYLSSSYDGGTYSSSGVDFFFYPTYLGNQYDVLLVEVGDADLNLLAWPRNVSVSGGGVGTRNEPLVSIMFNDGTTVSGRPNITSVRGASTVAGTYYPSGLAMQFDMGSMSKQGRHAVYVTVEGFTFASSFTSDK